jgi:putative SOS response-associated peptidase YedK
VCGRMTLTRSAAEIAEFFAIAGAGAESDGRFSGPNGPDGGPLRPRYNLAPSQPVLTVVPVDAAALAFAWKIWGLVPAWAKEASMGGKLFNARAETVAEKPSFRSAFKRRRCLVVADGFYEWTPRNRGHRAHWLHPRQAPLLAFAGLHERWSAERGPALDTCTVITTEANGDLAGIHARMPVLLDAASWRTWLDPDPEPEALKALLVPAPDGTLEVRVVGGHVNDPRHDDPTCLGGASGDATFRLDGGSSR